MNKIENTTVKTETKDTEPEAVKRAPKFLKIKTKVKAGAWRRY